MEAAREERRGCWGTVVEFEELEVAGAYLILQQRRADERGWFARTWCGDTLAKRRLVGRVMQINTGFSPRAHTLRGVHFQTPPHAEVKIVRCTRGAVFDVVVDLRRGSPTYRRWAGRELTPDNGCQLYVPEGCGHGYLTLVPDSEVEYTASHAYAPAAARGVRYDDPAFGIAWPAAPVLISVADRGWPDFTDADAMPYASAHS